MADTKRDYYEVLSVSRDADDAAIKKAYRDLAKKYHPDHNQGDANAEAKFKEASEAYAVLSDPDKRRQYDQFGHSAFDGGGGFDASGFDFTDMGDIFGDIFGDLFGGGSRSRSSYNGPMKGANLRASVRITFEDAINGIDKEIELNGKEECHECHGSGAKPGTNPVTCTKCNGTGQISQTQQSIFGMIRNVQTCPECGGQGTVIKEKCPHCYGQGFNKKRKRINVPIPAGIDDGQSVRIRGEGDLGRNGGEKGDLLVEIVVSKHPTFRRQDTSIYSTVPISYAKAALGGEITIKTVDGEVIYDVKAGTQTDTKIRLKGKGVPYLRNKNLRGDHFVTLVIQVPEHLSKEQKEALKKFQETMGETPKNGKSGDEKNKRKGLFNK